MAAIYYPFTVPPVSGGDFINLDHVAGLDRLGLNARVLYCAEDDGLGQFPVPAVRLGSAPLRPDDILVIGESHHELLRQAHGIPIRRVLHNQGAYYTFYGFNSVAELNAYPFDHVLVASDFAAAKLRQLGVAHAITRVRPALPSFFQPSTKTLRIAFSPSKRPTEILFLVNYFKALAPRHAHVPWVPLAGKTRAECAVLLGESGIYASFAQLEGLGLMNLEAMASGCHVVGYTGHGGAEYASRENGDWIAEGDHDGFVAGLRDACALFETGSDNPKIAAGLATAAQFSQGNFARELEEAWKTILGARLVLYRKP